jgi:hypothetical protein
MTPPHKKGTHMTDDEWATTQCARLALVRRIGLLTVRKLSIDALDDAVREEHRRRTGATT